MIFHYYFKRASVTANVSFDVEVFVPPGGVYAKYQRNKCTRASPNFASLAKLLVFVSY